MPPYCRNPLILPNHGERVGVESGGHAALAGGLWAKGSPLLDVKPYDKAKRKP